RAFSYDAVRGLLFLAHHLEVLFGLFTRDGGLVADHDDGLIDRLGLDDHALLVRGPDHIKLSGERRRNTPSHYCDSDDILQHDVPLRCGRIHAPPTRAAQAYCRLPAPSVVAPSMVPPATKPEDDCRATVPIAVVAGAISTIAVATPPAVAPMTVAPSAPVHRVD